MAVTNAVLAEKIDGLAAVMTDFIEHQRGCNQMMKVDIRGLQIEQAKQSERIGTLGKVFGGIQAVITGTFTAAVAALWGKSGGG